MILLRIPPENHATIMVQISPVEPRLSSVELSLLSVCVPSMVILFSKRHFRALLDGRL